LYDFPLYFNLIQIRSPVQAVQPGGIEKAVATKSAGKYFDLIRINVAVHDDVCIGVAVANVALYIVGYV